MLNCASLQAKTCTPIAHIWRNYCTDSVTEVTNIQEVIMPITHNSMN